MNKNKLSLGLFQSQIIILVLISSLLNWLVLNGEIPIKRTKPTHQTKKFSFNILGIFKLRVDKKTLFLIF